MMKPGVIKSDEDFNTKMNVVSGLIRDDESTRLLRLLYRVSRGKVATFFKTVENNEYEFGAGPGRNTVFVLVFEDTK